jgi:ribosomal protein S17E
MGRVKSLMIKKAAQELFTSVEGFGEDFDKNKKLLSDTMPYKSIRNKVAGGITRLAKQQRVRKSGVKVRSKPLTEETTDDGTESD